MNWATCRLGIYLALHQAREFLSSCKHRRWGWALLHLSAGFVLLSDTCVAAVGQGSRCPVCGWQGRRYFYYLSACEPHLRPNAMCPQCGALERQRDIARWLREKASPPELMLYVAPNRGLLQMIAEWAAGPVVSADIRGEGESVQTDLHSLGFRDECFDLIVCSHVLEHVRDDIQCMGEVFRVLTSEGVAILPVPINLDLEKTVEYGVPRQDLNAHTREYGCDYFERLTKVGLLPIPEAGQIIAVAKG